MTKWVALFAMLGLFVLGCDSKPEQPSGGPAPAAKAPAPAPAPTPPPAPAPAPAPKAEGAAPAAGAAIGVAECDDYIKKMEACIAKAPAAAKPGMEMGLKTSRETWSKIAAGPAKAGLATGCKAAADAMAANPVCK